MCVTAVSNPVFRAKVADSLNDKTVAEKLRKDESDAEEPPSDPDDEDMNVLDIMRLGAEYSDPDDDDDYLAPGDEPPASPDGDESDGQASTGTQIGAETTPEKKQKATPTKDIAMKDATPPSAATVRAPQPPASCPLATPHTTAPHPTRTTPRGGVRARRAQGQAIAQIALRDPSLVAPSSQSALPARHSALPVLHTLTLAR